MTCKTLPAKKLLISDFRSFLQYKIRAVLADSVKAPPCAYQQLPFAEVSAIQHANRIGVLLSSSRDCVKAALKKMPLINCRGKLSREIIIGLSQPALAFVSPRGVKLLLLAYAYIILYPFFNYSSFDVLELRETLS